MDRYKKNPRSYRLIAPFLKDNVRENPPEDPTPMGAITRMQNKYVQLHDEITKEADVCVLHTSSTQPAEVAAAGGQTNQEVFLNISSSMSVFNVTDINEHQLTNTLPKVGIDDSHNEKKPVIHRLAISSVLPKDGIADNSKDTNVPELGFTSENDVGDTDVQTCQTVLLDISNSLPVSHTSFKNIATGNDDNVSVFSEIDNAYNNLIQLENCEFGSNSMQLDITTNELQENDFVETQENSLINNTDIFESQLNFSSPSILISNNHESQITPALSPHTITPETLTEMHDENSPQDPSTSNVAINENLRTGRPKKGRKRKHVDQTRDIRKRLCQTNKQYINQKGHVVKPREFVDVRCNDGCHEKITATERKTEFLKLWELCFEAKCLYISSNVKVIPIKRKRNKKSKKRNNTRIYSIRNQKVCAKMFIDTLKISSARIDRYLKKSSAADKIEDKRGKESGKQHKMPQETEQSIIDHIDKFPKYKSHYCRAQTDRMFLPPDMTLQKMYDLYLSEASPGESRRTVSFSSYKKIFYTKFNLQRKKPQKDTCNKCDVLAIKIRDARTQNEKNILEKERELHYKEAEDARAMKKQDLSLAKTCDHLEVLTFDMEKTLPLPRIPTNIVFYKRQLWLYNCGIHSGKTGKGFCYVWVEGTAGRGAQEVGSALRKHVLSPNLDCKVKELILWSDSCGGQNRNIKLILLLFAIMEENTNLEQITLRFMIPGHSFLENDSEFGDIESALKTHTRLYTPQDYMDVMTSCRKRNKLTAIKMEEFDFVGVSKMMKIIVNRKKDVCGNPVSWLKTKQIVIYKNKPGRLYMSTTHGGLPQEVDLNKRQKRGTTSNSFILSNQYEQLWPKGKQISQPKLNDIKSLLHLIPSDARKYYENLTGSDNVVDDVEGFNGSLDFDVEHFEED